MKILLISSTNNIKNGTGNMTHELCMFLKGKVDFKLLLPFDEKRYDYTSYPVEYILPTYIFNTRTPKVLKYLFFKYKTDADIIHSVLEFPHSLVAARIAIQNNKPLVLGVAGTYGVKLLLQYPDKFFIKYLYRKAKIILAISKFTADALKRFSKTTTPVEVIHCAVNFDRFSTITDFDYIKNKFVNKKILLTVGGLKPRKGQDIVLKALSLLKKERDDFHYLVVGDEEKRNSYVRNLREIAEMGKIINNVTFTGIISDEDLPKYFQACDIYIHTPVAVDWNFEGFGIVYLEAGSAHKPVIASNSGGVLDAVIPSKTGIVVPENDIIATANAIRELLDNPLKRKEFGEAGLKYAEEHKWDTIGKSFLEIYKNLL